VARLDPSAVGRPLGRVEWLALAVLTAAATAALHVVFAPGLMSYDSLVFYEQAVGEIRESTWPPMYAYLIRLVRAFGGGYGALFLLQAAAVLACGGWLAMRLSGGGPARRLLALDLYFLAFVAVPPLLGSMIVLWNVVAVAAALLAGLALQWAAATTGRLAFAIAAAAAYAVCFALRYNAVFLLALPVLALILWPTGPGAGGRARAASLLAVAAFFAAAFASFSHRLPDLQRLPANAGVRTIQTFDLIGVSACAGTSYLTPEMTARGPVTIADLRAHYDPRHLNLSLAPRPGTASLVKPRDGAQVHAAWLTAVRAEPGCYLQHRWAVFAEQMGFAGGELFYPTHGEVHPNRFGYVLQRPELALPVVRWIDRAADHPLLRPGWLYLGAVAAVALLWRRRDPRVLPLAVLTASAFAYAGSHLFITPAADARYIFPSSVLCAVVVAAAIGGRGRPVSA
jgi:hypothetical protein